MRIFGSVLVVSICATFAACSKSETASTEASAGSGTSVQNSTKEQVVAEKKDAQSVAQQKKLDKTPQAAAEVKAAKQEADEEVGEMPGE